jgi:hypothetical protein
MLLPYKILMKLKLICLVILCLSYQQAISKESNEIKKWTIGDPIVSYYAGPGFEDASHSIPMTDEAAKQLAEGGWNLVWCNENELDIIHRHGLRGMLKSKDLYHNYLDTPKKVADLNALITRVKNHPALYCYFLADEPSSKLFPMLSKTVAYIKQRDPAHLSYINLLPTYANSEQLGIATSSPHTDAFSYKEHLRQYVEIVKPNLLSYDHYHFLHAIDNPGYFLNLELMREKALKTRLPFMNIVQAASWGPTNLASPDSPRVPNAEEMRFLVYTTLAYGAQGISYYVYCWPGHQGGIANADGTPTALYEPLKVLNKEFVAIAKELKPFQSLHVAHAGILSIGTAELAIDSAFKFDPVIANAPYAPGQQVEGCLIGNFGKAGNQNSNATHALIVNLNYKAERLVTIKAKGKLEKFDPTTKNWSEAGTDQIQITLPAGGGTLIRKATK